MPDGWPIWTSEVRPGRQHDTSAVRTHTEILPALTTITGDLRTLGDLGYEGEADTITVAFKKPRDSRLTFVQQQLNQAHNGVRAIAKRGNALLEGTFKARNVSLSPGGSARSSLPSLSSSTSTTSAQHNALGNKSLRGMAHFAASNRRCTPAPAYDLRSTAG
ncbi:hypothetical protein GCM10022255_093770 [Dactylosporangium darangshiense]|uniref:DDE Tnp4 domain-containing protein n=1 Tax=Dactylosporangium darangshiense TaxID=579108 RepID=A0ABP8DPX0_9ACTN